MLSTRSKFNKFITCSGVVVKALIFVEVCPTVLGIPYYVTNKNKPGLLWLLKIIRIRL